MISGVRPPASGLWSSGLRSLVLRPPASGLMSGLGSLVLWSPVSGPLVSGPPASGLRSPSLRHPASDPHVSLWTPEVNAKGHLSLILIFKEWYRSFLLNQDRMVWSDQFSFHSKFFSRASRCTSTFCLFKDSSTLGSSRLESIDTRRLKCPCSRCSCI